MAEKLKIGVIGVGYLGRFHALIYSRMIDVELIGVVDTDPIRAKQVAQEVGTCGFTEPNVLLGQVNAVSVVVPTSRHLEVAKPYLDAGVHMLLEKPIADHQDSGRQIVNLAKDRGVILQIGHLERFNAGVMALADSISRPCFIEAHRLSPFVARATDVDVISDLMIHDIDIILSLIDSPIDQISAVGKAVLTDHLDISNARLEFENGAVANVIASRVSREKMRRIRVFERQRYQSLDFIEQTLDVVYPMTVEGQDWPEIVTERTSIEPVKPLDVELRAFVDSVRFGKPVLVSGEVGLKALDVALQIKSKIAGRPN